MRSALPRSPVPLWRPVAADPRTYFSEDDVARSKAYQRPLQYAKLVAVVLGAVEMLALIAFDAAPAFVRWTGLDGWPLQLLAIIVAFTALDTLVSLPVAVFRLRHDRTWGFEKRDAKTFALDQVKTAVLNAFVYALIFLPLWAIIRATRLWWLVGGLVLLLVGLLLALLSPALQRIFFKFTPMEEGPLRSRLLALAERAGARVGEIFVMDASKRTGKDNAFFAGLGKTKRIVVFDNMLELGDEAVEVVVAHEIGHWRRRHIVSGVLLTALTAPVLLGAAALFLRWEALLAWGGVASEREPAAFPILLLGAGAGFVVLNFFDTWVSRWKERTADLDSLEMTGNIEAYRALWHRMPARNLPDLDPSWWQRIRLTHPPVAERLAFGDVWASSRGLPSRGPAGRAPARAPEDAEA